MSPGFGEGRETPLEKGCAVKRRAESGASPKPCPSRSSIKGKVEADLLSETVKWQGKAQDLYENISGEEEFMENISAYIRDCQYFLEKDDLIRAFEAIIWAWAWMEIGLQKGILRHKK